MYGQIYVLEPEDARDPYAQAGCLNVIIMLVVNPRFIRSERFAHTTRRSYSNAKPSRKHVALYVIVGV